MFNQAIKNVDSNIIKYSIRDEEYLLDTSILKEFIKKQQDIEINMLLQVFDNLKIDSKFSVLLDIKNENLLEKATEKLLSKGAKILDNNIVSEIEIKKLEYIDIILKYNTVIYKKRYTDFVKRNKLRDKQILNLFAYDGYYIYKLNKLIKKKNHELIYKSLGYKYLFTKKKYYY